MDEIEYKKSPLKAIREKCLDCCCGSHYEVKSCTAIKCPIYPFRMGKNPFRVKREISEEHLQKLRDNIKKITKGDNCNEE